MFNLFDKFVHQAEQSRQSYNVQTEEFRLLNSNFNDYLDEMKTIDENNRQLQQMIDEIRTNYLVTLENHLIRVPEELRHQSRILTAAHHERYKQKSRARRFIAEREELKRRIHFVAADEKEQIKRLNQLEKQHRIICKEHRRIIEQIDHLMNYVEHEKVLHRQAMQRVDQLQHEFERICVERSTSEFEIQSLKEEIQRMQTAREFLDDERELFLSNQTEAEEYFLSHLNESIQRIREDFEQLNRSQLKQLENDYEEKLRWIDEYSRRTSSSTSSSEILTDDSQRVEHEQLENDFRIVTQELNIVNDQYQTLTQRVQQMEIDLYILREDRQRQLASKDHEFERNQMQLQTLNEQLTILAEYDRNLKFELTLYRGVLENEYRRKQQRTTNNKKKMSSSNGTSRTDKTATAFPIDLQTTTIDDSLNRVRVESDYDQLGESTNGHVQTIVEPSSPTIEIQPPSSTDTSTTSLRSIDQCVESSSSSSIQTVLEQIDNVQFHRQTTSILSSKDIEEILNKNFTDETSVPRIPSPMSEDEPDLVVDLSAKPTEEEAAAASSSVPIEHVAIGGLSSIVVRPEESSQDSSFTDVEEITSSLPVEQTETKLVEDEQEPNLIGIMQDLRFVFHDLANADGLVEINAELPDKLLDRLEFRDHLIRTLFDSLLRKYLVQSAAQSQRSTTLDWTEFRDILFPIITGRRTERQIRTLFNLFDTRKDGYLSLQEIAELLEILQANDTIDLAQNIIDEFDTDHDGKLSADELIEAIKKTDDINENVLSEEFETKQWFTQAPTDEMSATSLEVVIGSTNEDKIIVLAQIFRKFSANVQTNLLDSFRENLTLDLTTEIVKMNIPIPNADLERFIELFIERRQEKNPFISWIDFRDFFLPIINGGYLTKSDIEEYFNLLDSFHRGSLTNDEILQFLRLIQINDANVVRTKLSEKVETRTDPNAGWTLDEFLFAFDNVDETVVRILSANDDQQRRNDFDLQWLTKELNL